MSLPRDIRDEQIYLRLRSYSYGYGYRSVPSTWLDILLNFALAWSLTVRL